MPKTKILAGFIKPQVLHTHQLWFNSEAVMCKLLLNWFGITLYTVYTTTYNKQLHTYTTTSHQGLYLSVSEWLHWREPLYTGTTTRYIYTRDSVCSYISNASVLSIIIIMHIRLLGVLNFTVFYRGYQNCFWNGGSKLLSLSLCHLYCAVCACPAGSSRSNSPMIKKRCQFQSEQTPDTTSREYWLASQPSHQPWTHQYNTHRYILLYCYIVRGREGGREGELVSDEW